MKSAHSSSLQALRHLARLHGVRDNYLDMANRRQYASAESLLAVLRTLGVAVERMNEIGGALRERQRVLAQQVIEPVCVIWRGTGGIIPLQLHKNAAAGRLECQWQLETGEIRRIEHRLDRLPVESAARLSNESFVTVHLPTPANLPAGYHRVTLEGRIGHFETYVFCVPMRCWQGNASGRRWGLFAPLYALHSKRSWGAGDFADLEQFITWLSRQGGHFAGTLPILPAFLNHPFEPSPYSPVSRLFWNEFYLDVTRVPELEACPTARRLIQSASFQQQLEKLRASSLVDYAEQMALKRRVLAALSRSFFGKPSARRRAFEDFLRQQPLVSDYARFRALHEQLKKPWSTWPAHLREGRLEDDDCRTSLRQYHLYVQWLAHEQLTQIADHARRKEVDLYLDMPLGVHRDGYDAWRYQSLFALEASGGAPPDPVFTHGQDWGFAPLHPQRSREQGHGYVRAYLRHHLRYARMLRFDHVMGLHRLYWVPRGLPASQGAYVEYPAEEFYAMLSIESHRHQALIIGENLGTVPPEVNESLDRHGVSGMFVVQYEARPQTNSALRPVPIDAVASLNTHDMPPFAAYWRGLDIEDRRELGLLKVRDVAVERARRDQIRKFLVRFLRRRVRLGPGSPEAESVFQAVVSHLGASAARWVLLNLEDLWLETVPQNTPGTSTERVNWRRKTRFTLEELSTSTSLLNLLRQLRVARRQ